MCLSAHGIPPCSMPEDNRKPGQPLSGLEYFVEMLLTMLSNLTIGKRRFGNVAESPLSSQTGIGHPTFRDLAKRSRPQAALGSGEYPRKWRFDIKIRCLRVFTSVYYRTGATAQHRRPFGRFGVLCGLQVTSCSGRWLLQQLTYSPNRLHRKVTICARVQLSLGLKVVAVVPEVTPSITAHFTASA